MMADENNTESTPEQAPGVPETPEVAKAKADASVAEAETEHAVTKEEPATEIIAALVTEMLEDLPL